MPLGAVAKRASCSGVKGVSSFGRTQLADRWKTYSSAVSRAISGISWTALGRAPDDGDPLPAREWSSGPGGGVERRAGERLAALDLGPSGVAEHPDAADERVGEVRRRRSFVTRSTAVLVPGGGHAAVQPDVRPQAEVVDTLVHVVEDLGLGAVGLGPVGLEPRTRTSRGATARRIRGPGTGSATTCPPPRPTGSRITKSSIPRLAQTVTGDDPPGTGADDQDPGAGRAGRLASVIGCLAAIGT